MDGCKGILSVDIAIILALPTPVSTEAFFSHFFDCHPLEDLSFYLSFFSC